MHGRQTLSLCWTVNPEEKCEIIGDTFAKVTDSATNDLNLNWENLRLGRGTWMSDVGLNWTLCALMPQRLLMIPKWFVNCGCLHGRVVEPNKDFHKDEVRALGRELGLLAELLMMNY